MVGAAAVVLSHPAPGRSAFARRWPLARPNSRRRSHTIPGAGSGPEAFLVVVDIRATWMDCHVTGLSPRPSSTAQRNAKCASRTRRHSLASPTAGTGCSFPGVRCCVWISCPSSAASHSSRKRRWPNQFQLLSFRLLARVQSSRCALPCSCVFSCAAAPPAGCPARTNLLCPERVSGRPLRMDDGRVNHHAG
jgi:hypothetical protein